MRTFTGGQLTSRESRTTIAGPTGVRHVDRRAEIKRDRILSSEKGWPMRGKEQYSIVPTHEMAEQTRFEYESGECASENELIPGRLHAIQLHEGPLDSWLRQQVAPVYDAMRANPSRAVSIEKVRASLAAARK